jgi:hypothetical protein
VTNIASDLRRRLEKEIAALTAQTLLHRLEEDFRQSAEFLLDAALCWVQAEKLGLDLSKYNKARGRALRAIAAGKVSVDLAYKFFYAPSVIPLMEEVPEDLQDEYALGKDVEVYEPRDGSVYHKPLIECTYIEASRVMHHGKPLSAEEQRGKAFIKRLRPNGSEIRGGS